MKLSPGKEPAQLLGLVLVHAGDQDRLVFFEEPAGNGGYLGNSFSCPIDDFRGA
jgi:hypothetical protein